MNWQSLALHFLLELLAPCRTRFAFCRTHKTRRVISRFKQLGLLAPCRTRFAFCRTHKTRRVISRFKQLGLLAPCRTRFAFCRTHKTRRVTSRFEQVFDAARLLQKLEIPAHEGSAAALSDIEILIHIRFDFRSIRE